MNTLIMNGLNGYMSQREKKELRNGHGIYH